MLLREFRQCGAKLVAGDNHPHVADDRLEDHPRDPRAMSLECRFQPSHVIVFQD